MDYYARGDFQNATIAFQRLLAITEQALGPDHLDVAGSLNNLAQTYVAQGRLTDAEPLLKRALAIREHVLGPDHLDVALTLRNLGILYTNEGRYREAERLLNRSLAIREKALGPDHPDVADSLIMLAALYKEEGRIGSVEPTYKRALAIFQKASPPDQYGVAAVSQDLALFYLAQERFRDAEPLFRRSLAVVEKAVGPDHPDVAKILVSLGDLYRQQGRYREAEPLLKRSLAIREKTFGPDHPEVAASLAGLAQYYQAQGRYADAEPLYKRSLAIRERTLGLDHPDVAATLNDFAGLYELQGRYGDAEGLWKRSLAIQEKLGPDHLDVALSLHNLAQCDEDQGRYADAEALYRRSLAIREKILGVDSPEVALGLNNLGHLYDVQARYAEAEPLLRRALAIREKTLGPDHPDVAASLETLGALLYDRDQYRDAEHLLKRALAMREKVLGPDHPLVARTLTNLGYLDMAQGRYSEALPLLRRGIAISIDRGTRRTDEGKGQQSELRGGRNLFLNYLATADHLVEAGDPRTPELREEAFAALQWAKTSDTAVAIARMAARFAAGNDRLAALVRARQDTVTRLEVDEVMLLAAISKSADQRNPAAEKATRNDIDTLRRRVREFDNELSAKFPAYPELINPRPLGIVETEALLAPDEALVVFAVGENETYVAMVTHDDYALHSVGTAVRDLTDAVGAVRLSLDPTSNSVPPFRAREAYYLYDKLVRWMEPYLAGKNHLMIVPAAFVESVPFAALLTDKPPKEAIGDPADLRAAPWLARRYAISVLPSVSSLRVLRKFAVVSRASKPFLGIGDPLLNTTGDCSNRGDQRLAAARGLKIGSVFHGDTVDIDKLRNLCSLPDTADELRTEASLLHAGPDALMLQGQATVTAVKRADLANRRVISFATHGLVTGDVGNAEPGLVMTPPTKPTQEDDGLLKASEIAKLRLDADMVILSACDTAASDGTLGAEGFSGLAKAFLYSGARSLVVSQWSVVSDATVRLMRGMFEATKAGTGRAAALQEAMIAVLNDGERPEFSHPLFWAPFVVVGEGGVVGKNGAR
jgi:CHAT domain-containing protein/Tfp pilus assembly protein PilF